jgi:hypothetical protein
LEFIRDSQDWLMETLMGRLTRIYERFLGGGSLEYIRVLQDWLMGHYKKTQVHLICQEPPRGGLEILLISRLYRYGTHCKKRFANVFSAVLIARKDLKFRYS